MAGKILFAASTRSHILTFHLPYLKALHEDGFLLHGAWGGTQGDVPYVDEAIFLPFEKQMTSVKNFAISRTLRRRIRAEGYDCVIVHTSLAAFFTRLAVLGLPRRPKVINMAHGYLFDDKTAPAKRAVLLAAEKLTAPVTDLLLTMNRCDHQLAVKHRLGKRIVNIPGIGVDLERLARQQADFDPALRRSLGFSREDFVLIYPAEFSDRKSQQVLIRALTLLPERVKLLLPGNGVRLEECRELAASLGVAHRVVFPGYVTDMGAWYPAADAAVSASRSEGLPFNIMEAMYSGLPVVASAVKGHTDLIEDGVCGLLYPYGDAAACAAQIRRLLDDPALARCLAQRGQEVVSRYELSRVFPQVMELYRSLLPVPAGR